MLKFSILNEWADILVVRLAKSIQAPNKNNCSACYRPPKVCSNENNSNVIYLKAANRQENSKSITKK